MRKRILSVIVLLFLLIGNWWALFVTPDQVTAQGEEPVFWVGDPIDMVYTSAGGEHTESFNFTTGDKLVGVEYRLVAKPGVPPNFWTSTTGPSGYSISWSTQSIGFEKYVRASMGDLPGLIYPSLDFAAAQGFTFRNDYDAFPDSAKDTVLTLNLNTIGAGTFEVIATPVYYGTNRPAPLHETCTSIGVDKTVDVLATGTITAGSIVGFDYAQGPLGPIDRIQFHISAPLPNIALGPGGQAGILAFTVGAPGVYGAMTVKNVKATIGGLEFNLQGGDVTIPGGSTSLEMDFSADIDVVQEWGNPQAQTGFPYMTSIELTYPGANNGETLICDGGMEQGPNYTWWQGTDPNLYFGRLNTLFDFGQILFNGQPACGFGHQLVGNGVVQIAMPGVATPVYQWFNWDGGTLYYKFRYKSGQDYWLLGIARGSPNVYLVDEHNVFVRDLLGSNTKDDGLVVSDWSLITGSTFLPQGQYGIVLDQGYVLDIVGQIDRNKSGHVYYDDVAVGLYAFSVDECSGWHDDAPPDAPTPTPTPSQTATTNVTTSPVVITSTNIPTGTPDMLTNTPGPTRTPPWKTSTQGPSPTYHTTRTPTGTVVPPTVGTPTITRTPYGTPIPSNTPVPVTPGTQTNTPQPLPSSTPGLPPQGEPFGTPLANPTISPYAWQFNPFCVIHPDRCDWGFDDQNVYCIYHPLEAACQGKDIQDPACGECTIPGDLEVARWINYEMCSTKSFVCWGNEENATAVAIPQALSQYEPFGTVGEVADGLMAIQTQAAAYNWNAPGVQGVHDPVNPDITKLLKGTGNDPWGNNAPIVNFQPGGGGSAADNGYTAFCSSALASKLSSRLAEGTCYALNQLRKIGYLPWVQVFINLGSIVIIIKMVRIFFENRVSIQRSETTGDLEYKLDQRSMQDRIVQMRSGGKKS